MKISEFKRYLESLGVVITNKTKHWELRYNGKRTILKRHPGQEIAPFYKNAILKQLGIDIK